MYQSAPPAVKNVFTDTFDGTPTKTVVTAKARATYILNRDDPPPWAVPYMPKPRAQALREPRQEEAIAAPEPSPCEELYIPGPPPPDIG